MSDIVFLMSDPDSQIEILNSRNAEYHNIQQSNHFLTVMYVLLFF